MKYPEGRTLDTLQRVQGFLDAHASALPSINQSSVRRVLDDTVARLAEHVRDQQHGVVSSTSETRRQRALREALRVAMRPFVTAAKLTADDVTPPELRTLSLPASDEQAQVLIGAASAMAKLARENEPLLQAGGLSEDAITKLDAARDAFARSLEVRDGTRRQASGATNALSKAARQGRRILRHVDALVVQAIRGDAKLEGEWSLAKKLTRKPGPVGSGLTLLPPETPTSNPEVHAA